MKKSRWFLILFVAVSVTVAMYHWGWTGWPGSPGYRIPKHKALRLAAAVPEVRALYHLDNGRLAACIQTEVRRPCETDYVTCIDEAWVVQYSLKPDCTVKSDGRLSVNLLLSSRDGHVISRYPEIEYFRDPNFCRDDGDCLCAGDGQPVCWNFIHAPLAGSSFEAAKGGVCRQHACQPQGPKSAAAGG